ncbi:hypothetical protein A7E78_13660 [Syntrophotalea acetylenivorans]|uniref:GDYXXLXY protein n=1 Tax=Syntrophotalea acetylenivorans TaxID=1842532 RepID=A0A1L3GS78_9BACT|nr:GDYXXLXY domain-containing protein [Syntrophotalea acetylenivorans]APG28781.1 hypothetical protein A7E78_13660 [Syntrophotalea acetylenivorans]
MSRLLGLALAILFLLQLAVPASMIAGREMTLRHGKQYRFRTAPVDPYDPFRGRYVSLNLVASRVAHPEGMELARRQRVYALLAVDEEGFAYCRDLAVDPPTTGDYLAARVSWWNKKHVDLKLPFDRYYAEEDMAPEIERAYRSHSRRDKQEAYITVRVRKGNGVLEELYIEDLPVSEYLRRQAG